MGVDYKIHGSAEFVHGAGGITQAGSRKCSLHEVVTFVHAGRCLRPPTSGHRVVPYRSIDDAATIHDDGLASDEVTVGAGQEQRGADNVLRLFYAC
jgi:hypothetical protein